MAVWLTTSYKQFAGVKPVVPCPERSVRRLALDQHRETWLMDSGDGRKRLLISESGVISGQFGALATRPT